MNKILHINKKILLLILILISLLFTIIIIKKNLNDSFNQIISNEKTQSFDIINPSFTINNTGEKISVKAKKGNFLSSDLILLENNVIFKSSRFKLETDKVIFNQKKQTAKSEHDSKFESDGTIILSEGFKINQNGEVILFNGNTILILKK